LSLGLLSLLLATSLTGCASNSQILRECPKQTPIRSAIDVSDWQSEVENYSTELTELLNSAQGTINED
ncbi:hypothetical protein, partial [uncultured Parasutterella sp.]|uniref:hypothetical protein n=1 Tax=uncultured Parasutterella sp. TaxID=1263098 RepID=UPI002596A62D